MSASPDVPFDLTQVPFSCRGSWLGLNRLSPDRATELGKEPGLFVRTYRGNVPMAQREALRVEVLPLRGALPLRCREIGRPGVCRLEGTANAWGEAAFGSPSTLRWRGAGCRLRLTAAASAYDFARPAGEHRWELNLFSSRLQLMLRLLRGSVSVEAPWEETRSLRIEIVVGPGTEGEAWEIALDEFEGAWTPAASEPAFPRIVRRRQREFATWLRQQPAIPQPLKKARALAAYVTWSALVDPAGNIGREAMLMSKNWMVNVWSWDHCFNAIALAERQPALAWDQWAMLFDHQHASGMLPDAINDRDVVWNFTKPPVHGWALGEMIARGFTPTPEQSRQAVRWLERWTNWWLEYRDDDHDGIPQYNHGNDSGWDNATLFGAGMPVEGPDLSTFLVLQMETVAALHARLGRKPAAARWRGRADALTQRLLGHSWRGGRFVGPRSGDHATADGDSLVAFMPLLLGRRLPQEVRERLVRGLAEPGRLLTRHGLATESPRSPLYRSDGYWRGPIWAPSTMLIVSGLQACGEHRLARTIAQRFCATFARSGSAENFDALSGAGLRDRAYTWTASVFIVLAGLLNGDRKTIPSR